MSEVPITLADGTTIIMTDSKQSPTGLKYTGYSVNSNGVSINPALKYESIVRSPEALANISSRGTLGFFDDPRKAAYLSGYFMKHPEEIIKKFKDMKQKFEKEGKRGWRVAVYSGKLAPDFPEDLFTAIPTPDPEKIKQFAAEKAREGDDVGTAKDMLSPEEQEAKRDAELLKMGAQEYFKTVMSDPEIADYVYKATKRGKDEIGKYIRTLAMNPARREKYPLANLRGVVKYIDKVQLEGKDVETELTNLVESQHQLDRIKQLTESISNR